MESIKSQIELTEVFPEPSYDDLKSALESYLNPEAGDEEADESEESDDETNVLAEKSVSEKKAQEIGRRS